jgi:hypothetical protein
MSTPNLIKIHLAVLDLKHMDRRTDTRSALCAFISCTSGKECIITNMQINAERESAAFGKHGTPAVLCNKLWGHYRTDFCRKFAFSGGVGVVVVNPHNNKNNASRAQSDTA